MGHCERVVRFMGREVKGDISTECTLSNVWSPSYREIKLLPDVSISSRVFFSKEKRGVVAMIS